MRPEDPRLTDAKARSILDVAQLLEITGTLRRAGDEWVGPCPNCGGGDRFSIAPRKGVFYCRQCQGKGDVIGLVGFVRACDFASALDWLCGPPRALSREERLALAERLRRARAAQERVEAAAEKKRAEAIAAAREIWGQGLPAGRTPVDEYLTLRGFAQDLLPDIPKCLRYHPALPYMVAIERGGWQEVHRGPAMLAAVRGPDGVFSAVHRTWIDLAEPKGKLKRVHAGMALDARKSLGSLRGGAIRLATPPGAEVLVMGEGIETTLSALVAAAPALSGAAFWAGIDLGNMSGKRLGGPGLKYAGLPNLADPRAFLPPPWVRRLIYVMDGDSEPRHTLAAMQAGLRRALKLRPGLVAQLVRAPQGMDFNDVLMQAETVEGASDA